MLNSKIVNAKDLIMHYAKNLMDILEFSIKNKILLAKFEKEFKFVVIIVHNGII